MCRRQFLLPTKPTVFSACITQIMRCIALDRYKEKSRKKQIPWEYTISMEDVKDTLHCGESVDNEYLAEEVGRIINGHLFSHGEIVQ